MPVLAGRLVLYLISERFFCFFLVFSVKESYGVSSFLLQRTKILIAQKLNQRLRSGPSLKLLKKVLQVKHASQILNAQVSLDYDYLLQKILRDNSIGQSLIFFSILQLFLRNGSSQ